MQKQSEKELLKMNFLTEFSRRQLINLLEKAVADKKLPDTLLFKFESCLSWPFTKDQERIFLSYATSENLKKSAGDSAFTVKSLGRMVGIGDKVSYPNPPLSEPSFSPPVLRVQPVIVRQEPIYVSHEPRYSRGEWERIQKAEEDKKIARSKVFPKDPILNKFYRKVEIEN